MYFTSLLFQQFYKQIFVLLVVVFKTKKKYSGKFNKCLIQICIKFKTNNELGYKQT